MSVTRKLYCRLTLGSFLTFKNALPPQDHLSSQDRQTHTFPLPSPPLLRSQWQSHRTSWSAEFKARMNNHLPLQSHVREEQNWVCLFWDLLPNAGRVDVPGPRACRRRLVRTRGMSQMQHDITALPIPRSTQQCDYLSHLGATLLILSPINSLQWNEFYTISILSA